MFLFYYITLWVAALAGVPLGFISKRIQANLYVMALSTAAIFVMALVHGLALYPANPAGFLALVPLVVHPYLFLFWAGTLLCKSSPPSPSSLLGRTLQYVMTAVCTMSFAGWLFDHASSPLFELGGYFEEIPFLIQNQVNTPMSMFSPDALKAFFGVGIGGHVLFMWLLWEGYWYVFVALAGALGFWLATRSHSAMAKLAKP